MTNDTPVAGTGGAPERRPRILLVVDNNVSVDSRVQKTARAAAAAGYDTVILGRSPSGGRVETEIGGVRTVLVPAPRHMAAHLLHEPARGRRPLAYRTRDQARDRSRRLSELGAGQLDRILELRAASPGLARDVELFRLRARVSWRQRLHAWRLSAFERNVADVAVNRGLVRRPRARLGLALTPSSTWRRVALELLDYDLSYTDEITALAPDLIHAHDFPMLVVATNAKARTQAAGRELKILHDVHEWIAGAPRRDPVWRSAVHHAELELIPRYDAVITVSDWLSDAIARECGLAVRPPVITNSPEAPSEEAARLAPSLRARCGLDDGVPLLVYSGTVSGVRGLATVIEALPALPGVHLAIVVGSGPNEHYDGLVARAMELGVADRMHRVGYVPQELVVPHLASADLGLIPITHALNHEISLMTKYREYMHARLPIVVSDVRTMGDFTREHGIGEVFVEGDTADLARAVRAVLDDPDTYRLGLTPELLVEHSWATQAERLVEVYASLVGRPGAPDSSAARSGGPVQ
ncbi:MAG TPA: glycosyltransferase [Candidatus Nanopelagicales bacterium]